MKKLLSREPVWGFLTFVVTLLIFIWGIYTYLATKPNRELTITEYPPVELVHVDPSTPQGVVVTYKGRPLASLISGAIKIQNTGNETINVADFVRPISLNFDEDGDDDQALSEIVQFNIEDTPSNIDPVISTSNGSIVLEPFLLDPGESITIQFLVARDSQSSDIVIPDIRIGGVKTRYLTGDDVHSQEQFNKLAVAIVAGALSSLIALGLSIRLSSLIRRLRPKTVEGVTAN